MRRLIILLPALALCACSSAYYGTMEKMGIHKREILVDRIEEAQDSQEKASEQFTSALEHFRSLVEFDGGDLEDLYDDLSRELARSEKRAESVRERIGDVQDVAGALFDEWEDELDQYSDAQLRSSSQQRLRETRRRYDQLMGAMERAEGRMDPVLDSFRDQVLFLKHNLNARAVAALREELGGVEGDVEQLVRDMNRSIEEARAFIATLEQPA